MSNELRLSEFEQLTAIVYGDTFALYDEKSFDEFLSPFYSRLKANKIDLNIFKDKRCLDAGCGGGRGSILMAQCGAREVIGVDLSPANIESSRKRAAQKGFTNLTFQQHSLIELPFEDESFDVVWCNGVLHHSENPDQGLREITRVLKKGGYLWLYLYGSGGIYWHVVDWIRETLQDVDVRDCISQLRLMDTPVRRIGEWIDDWFVPHLRRYTVEDVTLRLDELGYKNTQALQFGVQYDTSQRRVQATANELDLMGDGDVRHFCRKVNDVSGNRHVLPDPPDGKGSPYVDAPIVFQFDGLLSEVAKNLRKLESQRGFDIAPYKILVSRSVHTKVRSLIENAADFDSKALHKHLTDLNVLLDNFVSNRK
ncbi:MAG: class I SAM-dependent methyltransferase [Anaerolineales bacterium]|nr:MAG: class I SAM-dependent methyltransferase [Anaerolineales bacterium]